MDWEKQSQMAPFDKPFCLTLGVGVGGFNDFPDNGAQQKPWNSLDVDAVKKFWKAVSPTVWPPYDTSSLIVDYVRVYSLYNHQI